MKFSEILGFDSKKYVQKIGRHDYSYHQLALNIYSKRRSIASSKASAATGVVCATVTAGMSLAGSAYSGRNISVEKQKLALLENEWERRGQPPLPKRHIKDTLIPIVLTAAIGVFTFSVDLGISNATATAAYATQAGMPGYAFNGHAVGAYYDVVEKGMGTAGKRLNNRAARTKDKWS